MRSPRIRPPPEPVNRHEQRIRKIRERIMQAQFSSGHVDNHCLQWIAVLIARKHATYDDLRLIGGPALVDSVKSISAKLA